MMNTSNQILVVFLVFLLATALITSDARKRKSRKETFNEAREHRREEKHKKPNKKPGGNSVGWRRKRSVQEQDFTWPEITRNEALDFVSRHLLDSDDEGEESE